MSAEFRESLDNMSAYLHNRSIVPPVDTLEPTFSDFAEIALYSFLLSIGLPVNAWALLRVGRRYQATRARIFLLHIHLNISDLLILIFHAFYRACWLFTYQWYGGSMLCRVIKFMDNLGVAFSGYVIVAIGFDRLSSLDPANTTRVLMKRVKWSLAIAWGCSIFISFPNLFLWHELIVYDSEGGFKQCVSIFKTYNLAASYRNASVMGPEAWKWLELSWSVGNVIGNFWLPAFLISLCYGIILRQVYDKLGDDGKAVQTIRYPGQNGYMNRPKAGGGGQKGEEADLRSETSLSASSSSGRKRRTRQQTSRRYAPDDTPPLLGPRTTGNLGSGEMEMMRWGTEGQKRWGTEAVGDRRARRRICGVRRASLPPPLPAGSDERGSRRLGDMLPMIRRRYSGLGPLVIWVLERWR